LVQQGANALEETIRGAKLAEAAATTANDAVTVMMLDAMKANALASEKQAAEIRQLTARVAALMTQTNEREKTFIVAAVGQATEIMRG
jgi:hypothetical protein